MKDIILSENSLLLLLSAYVTDIMGSRNQRFVSDGKDFVTTTNDASRSPRFTSAGNDIMTTSREPSINQRFVGDGSEIVTSRNQTCTSVEKDIVHKFPTDKQSERKD